MAETYRWRHKTPPPVGTIVRGDGRAFDNDAGWRIDYHVATPGLAQRATATVVERAPAYDARWSDHAPVTVTFDWPALP